MTLSHGKSILLSYADWQLEGEKNEFVDDSKVIGVKYFYFFPDFCGELGTIAQSLKNVQVDRDTSYSHVSESNRWWNKPVINPIKIPVFWFFLPESCKTKTLIS